MKYKSLNYLWLVVLLEAISLSPLYSIQPTGHCDEDEPSKAPIILSPKITYSSKGGKFISEPPVLEWCTYIVGEGEDSKWKATVTMLTLPATINIKQWTPEQTPAPTVGKGGNVTSNNWQAIVQELQEYDTPGPFGKAGPNWHTTEATKAHEMYHWEQEWIEQCVKFYWPTCEESIESYEDKDYDALVQKVSQRFYNFKMHCNNKYAEEFDAIDEPGKGSGAYAAGKAVLLQVIAEIQAFAEEQGWTE